MNFILRLVHCAISYKRPADAEVMYSLNTIEVSGVLDPVPIKLVEFEALKILVTVIGA